MISEYHITLKLTDEERARIDKLRGNRGLDEFVQATVTAVVQAPTDEDNDLDADLLTVEDHLRLIAQAEQEDYMELDEIEEHFRQRRAARHAGDAVGVA